MLCLTLFLCILVLEKSFASVGTRSPAHSGRSLVAVPAELPSVYVRNISNRNFGEKWAAPFKDGVVLKGLGFSPD